MSGVCVSGRGGGGIPAPIERPHPQLKLRSAITNSSVTLTVTAPSLTYAYHFLGVSRTLFWLSLSIYVYFTNINTRSYFICANSYISSVVQRVMNKQIVVITGVSTAYYCNRFKNQAMQHHFSQTSINQ